eukprot:gene16788-19966_t
MSHMDFRDQSITSVPLTITRLRFESNRSLIGYLPPNLLDLSLGKEFKQSLVGVLPLTLTRLKLESWPLEYIGPLPSLTHLTLNYQSTAIHGIKEGLFPSSITHLKVNQWFDQDGIQAALPRLTHLTIVDTYSGDIKPGVIPSSVTHLYLPSFNRQLVAGFIPNSATHLTFGLYNHDLKPGCIPSSVTHLNLGEAFNSIIGSDNLPNNLTHLLFSEDSRFNQPIVPGSLPLTLTHLYFGDDLRASLFRGCLPPNLKHLILGSGVSLYSDSLPASLESLIVYCFDPYLDLNNFRLPSTLTRLVCLGDAFKLDLVSSAPQLNYLAFDAECDIVPGSLPPTLTHLFLHSAMPLPTSSDCWPISLTHITLSGNTDIITAGMLPSTITHLKLLGDYHEHSLEAGSLPSSLIQLDICYDAIRILFHDPSTPQLISINHPIYTELDSMTRVIKEYRDKCFASTKMSIIVNDQDYVLSRSIDKDTILNLSWGRNKLPKTYQHQNK